MRTESRRSKTFRLSTPGGLRHEAGQHVVLRLRAPDGYTAQRSYSVASAPDRADEFELTIELLPGGEVSSYMHDVVVAGDRLEVKGPIGRWFVWDGASPAVLIGGGSGVVPLMAMLRLARAVGAEQQLRVVVSARSPDDLYYRHEIAGPVTTVLYTRRAPEGARPPGRIRPEDLLPTVSSIAADARVYVCGSNGFADAVTSMLEQLGVDPKRIRVERFGPT